MANSGIIYKVTNLTNNKCYIGLTTQSFNSRRLKHLWDSKNRKDNNYFHNALIEYGEDNFKWEVLCECESIKELRKMETIKIIEHNSHRTKNGYNLTWGGEDYDTMSNHPNKKQIYDKIGKTRIIKGSSKGCNNGMYGVNRFGTLNPNSKMYKIFCPDGKIIIVNCLKIWCKENNINYLSIMKYMKLNKLYKGYHCIKWG